MIRHEKYYRTEYREGCVPTVFRQEEHTTRTSMTGVRKWIERRLQTALELC